MVGLALEGGGARGAAHVGVLQALEEEGLRPSAIAGTSAGSIVAAAYALHGSLEDVQMLLTQASALGTRLLDIDIGGIARGALQLLTRRNFRTMGLIKGDKLYKWIDHFMRGASVSEAAVPIVMPAVNLCSGGVVAFASQEARYRGNYQWETGATLAQAVRSSCAIPVVFKPFMLGGSMLVDGGVLENLPVRALLAMGSPKVFGVLINVEEGKEAPPDDIVGVGLRTIHVMQRRLEQYEESAATALLRVTLPQGSGLLAMDRLEEYQEYGYRTAIQNMPKIRRFFKSSSKPAASGRPLRRIVG